MCITLCWLVPDVLAARARRHQRCIVTGKRIHAPHLCDKSLSSTIVTHDNMRCILLKEHSQWADVAHCCSELWKTPAVHKDARNTQGNGHLQRILPEPCVPALLQEAVSLRLLCGSEVGLQHAAPSMAKGLLQSYAAAVEVVAAFALGGALTFSPNRPFFPVGSFEFSSFPIIRRIFTSETMSTMPAMNPPRAHNPPTSAGSAPPPPVGLPSSAA